MNVIELLRRLWGYLLKYQNLTILDLIIIAVAAFLLGLIFVELYKYLVRITHNVWNSNRGKLNSLKRKKRSTGLGITLVEVLELKKKPPKLLTWQERRRLKKAENHPLFGKLDIEVLEKLNNFNINDIKPVNSLAEINKINETYNNIIKNINKGN